MPEVNDLERILPPDAMAKARVMLADGFSASSITKHLPPDFPEDLRGIFAALLEELMDDPHRCVKCGELTSKEMCAECFRNGFDYFRLN